jgi:hypothetical protein
MTPSSFISRRSTSLSRWTERYQKKKGSKPSRDDTLGLWYSRQMLRSGWAFVRPDFLSAERAARLCAIEAEARLAKRGMWAGRWHERPYFRKGGTNKTLVEISCPPHDEAASE